MAQHISKAKEVSLQYRCRRCGAVHIRGCTSGGTGFSALIANKNGRPFSLASGDIGLYETHTCEDGGAGLSDFIGLGLPDSDGLHHAPASSAPASNEPVSRMVYRVDKLSADRRESLLNAGYVESDGRLFPPVAKNMGRG